MEIIRLKNLSKIYETVAKKDAKGTSVIALDSVSLSIKRGEYVAITGPSGSGKSTLMQILGLLDRPTSGSYFFLDQEVSSLSENIVAEIRSKYVGFVFQFFNLLARASALENVELPLIYSREKNRRKKARELLDLVGLGDRLEHAPYQLSGGQQQRVAIARALANDPHIVFADEPTGNLNQETAKEIMAQLDKLHLAGVTIILVTHDTEVASHAERVIKIIDGKIVSDEYTKKKIGSQANEINIPLKSTRFSIDLTLIKENFKMAIKALLTNKLRTALSMLGIMIGSAAVIAMVAIGQGAQKSIEQRLEQLGSNMLHIRADMRQTMHTKKGSGARANLTKEDAAAIKLLKTSGAPIKEVAPLVSGSVTAVYKNANWSTQINGTTANYAVMQASVPQVGRFFTDDENDTKERVSVIGKTIYEKLFESGENPLGAIIKINRINFQVIGVLPEKGSGPMGDQDDTIIIPLNTAMERVLGKDNLNRIMVEVADQKSMDQTIDLLTSVLRKRHKLREDKEDDFNIRNMAEIQETINATTKTMTMLLGSIAAISLLVGGIGIMNIMLVSVKERTREIGLRKALGAKKKDILLQFLIEAAVIGVIGGGIGILTGNLISLSITFFFNWLSIVSASAISLAFAFSFLIGIVFGFWPARQAAQLSPIEALRYE